MFTDNEQNNHLYRGYNPAFVKSVLKRRAEMLVKSAVDHADFAVPDDSMASIANAVAAARGLDPAEVRRPSNPAARSRSVDHARSEVVRLVKGKRPELTSAQVGTFLHMDSSRVRTIWRRSRESSSST